MLANAIALTCELAVQPGSGTVIVLAIDSSTLQLELGGSEKPKRRPEEKRLHHHQRECEGDQGDQGEKEFPSPLLSLSQSRSHSPSREHRTVYCTVLPFPLSPDMGCPPGKVP